MVKQLMVISPLQWSAMFILQVLFMVVGSALASVKRKPKNGCIISYWDPFVHVYVIDCH